MLGKSREKNPILTLYSQLKREYQIIALFWAALLRNVCGQELVPDLVLPQKPRKMNESLVLLDFSFLCYFSMTSAKI